MFSNVMCLAMNIEHLCQMANHSYAIHNILFNIEVFFSVITTPVAGGATDGSSTAGLVAGVVVSVVVVFAVVIIVLVVLYRRKIIFGR